MKITKVGHACLIVEEGGAKLLIDPGNWNPEVVEEGIDAILITHDHADHCDIGKIQHVLAHNPDAVIITHEEVGKKLEAAGLKYQPIAHNEVTEVKGVKIQSCGLRHAIIFGDLPQCQNTGFVIADALFVTGDALHDLPEARIKVLALPVGGPWMKLAEALEYAKKVAPKVAFPVHDAMYTDQYHDGLIAGMGSRFLADMNIEFRDMKPGTVEEFET
jgi:L-ascorbate metabolism protein UlaG (beta-lactamase superfamily)